MIQPPTTTTPLHRHFHHNQILDAMLNVVKWVCFFFGFWLLTLFPSFCRSESEGEGEKRGADPSIAERNITTLVVQGRPNSPQRFSAVRPIVIVSIFKPRTNIVFSDLRNEITTILTPSTSEGGEWGRWGGQVIRFGGPWLRIHNVNILKCIYVYTSLWRT